MVETVGQRRPRPDLTSLGAEMYGLVGRLYPVCRSITGDGVRETLRVLSEIVPLEISEVASGTPVLDWTVPLEWHIRDAYVADTSGRRVIDMRRSNLHVVNYSIPVNERMTLTELRPRLHTLPEHPDWVPYRTTYYERAWGFCLSQRQLDGLAEGQYDVRIDSTLEEGHLTYGELVLPGESDEEILISAHVCHPSLADDNLSGVAVATYLARYFATVPHRRTLRFVFAPGTIGAITWLARNRESVGRIRAGLTLACLGDAHPFTYKRTVGGETETDRAASYVLSNAGGEPPATPLQRTGAGNQIIDFFPYGYDERQYNSPGFRLPVGALMRGRHGRFPEYHTSADDLSFVSAARLAEAWDVVVSILEVIDGNRRIRSLAPYGEPQLGRRGLYRELGGSGMSDLESAVFWVLSLGDGEHDLLDVAGRSGLAFDVVLAAADLLEVNGLLARGQGARTPDS